MYNLSTFYQCNDWITLMKQIKRDRMNDEGVIICEHCGKEIVRAYDCIGHHKIALTEANVNDVMVSLNADNIMLVHHKCHSIIHDRLGMSNARRQVYLVYGAPCSGKTTYVESVMNEGDLIIDMDNMWQCVSGCDRYLKPNRLKSVVFGMRDYLLDCVKYRRGKWQNAYIIGGYPLISERHRLCRELGAREVFIDTDKSQCISNLDQCTDNRDKLAWLTFIDNWFEQYRPPHK